MGTTPLAEERQGRGAGDFNLNRRVDSNLRVKKVGRWRCYQL